MNDTLNVVNNILLDNAENFDVILNYELLVAIKKDLQTYNSLLKYLHIFSDTARKNRKYEWFDLIISSDKKEFKDIKNHLKDTNKLKRVSVV